MYRRALVAVGVAACGPQVIHPPAPAADPPITFVVAERTATTARLVGLGPSGDREYALMRVDATHPAPLRETQPVISPDGKWIAFTAQRESADAPSRIWIAPLAADATPVPLDDGPGSEAHPTWAPDGSALVFASTVGGRDFDLWRMPIAHGRAAGRAVQLTSAVGYEITPSVAPDGAVAYSAVTVDDTGHSHTHLELLAPDGTITPLTTGDADVTPAFAPDGQSIAFARSVEHATTGAPLTDSDLFTIPRAGGEPTPVLAVPLTDESGPVWSRDGRFLFATSVLRGEAGNILFSSVMHVDLHETPRHARMLRDRVRAYVRLTPAVTSVAVDATALHSDPEYLPELQRIVTAAIAEQVQPTP